VTTRSGAEAVTPMRERWVRGLFMVLFAIAYNIVEILVAAVAILQFLIVLVTGRVNGRLRFFGAGLSAYAYRIFLFLTYCTEIRPWPFSEWPERSES
jgi:hypothetical protein